GRRGAGGVGKGGWCRGVRRGGWCMAGGAWRLPRRRASWSCSCASAAARMTAPPLRAAPGRVWPEVPKLLVWDNAPPHHPKRVQAVAAAANIRLGFLPFRAPELMPCEDLWRLAKAVVAANRVYQVVQEQAERAVTWLAALSPYQR